MKANIGNRVRSLTLIKIHSVWSAIKGPDVKNTKQFKRESYHNYKLNLLNLFLNKGLVQEEK